MSQIDALVISEIFDDKNFKRLADDKIESDEFDRLVEEHVGGYSQKRRLSEGLKTLAQRVADIENKLIVMKNVGKSKQGAVDPEEKMLTEIYSSHELKEKLQKVKTLLDAMLDKGQITQDEKPIVLEQLNQRLAAAKQDGKAKLEEKLDKLITTVCKAEPFVPPVSNVAELHPLNVELQVMEKLEKRKTLNAHERIRLSEKEKVQETMDELVQRSSMWFETQHEFKPRLNQALIDFAAAEAERIRKEEEDAREKKRLEDDQVLERKRKEAAEKEEKKQRALEEKLQQKKLEAEAKPQKEAPQPKKKEKKVATKVNLIADGWFNEPEYEPTANETETVWAVEEQEAEAPPSKVKAAVEKPQPKPKEPAAKPKPVAKKLIKREEIESKWGVPVVPAATGEEGEDIDQDTEEALPSLVEANATQAPVKKEKIPPPQPKKKEKKKFTKIGAGDLGFDANNPNMYR